MHDIFLQFAVVLALSSIFGFVVLRLKLPLVVAYLLAGVSLSLVSIFGGQHTAEIFTFLPEIGIAFVLFLIGMELDFKEIRSLGIPIVVSSIGQVIISTAAGYAIAGYLGFSQMESFYMGLGLSFSSTLVVVKMLLEKRDLNSLYGKLSIGILIIEDLVAILALMVLTVTSSSLGIGFQNTMPILTLLLKAAGLFLLTFFLSKYVLNRILTAVASSVELLVLVAISWCFVFTALAVLSGFSVVIGAFLAGIALASSPYHLQIQGKVKPLRDFFVTLFFVYLGTKANVYDFIIYLPTIGLFTLYALIIKPITIMAILGSFGFRKHTLFQTALNLSQISEFSLVVLLLGVQTGVVSNAALSVMAAVAVISIIFSSITIAYSKRIFKVFSPFLGFFEHTKMLHFYENQKSDLLEGHVVVIGAHRVGKPVVRFLKKMSIPFIVMDFNPHVIEELLKEKISVVYGDVGDPEILDSLQLNKAKLIICTATDITDNELLIEEARRKHFAGKIICRALDEDHAKILKEIGADYVLMPEQVSGHFLVDQLKNKWPNVEFDDGY